MSAVHGVYLFADTSSIPLQLDANEPGAGYTHFFGIGSSSARPFYGWVPGAKPFYFPGNLNFRLDSGARIIVQLEYTDEAAGKLDSTRINLLFDTNALARPASVLPLLNHEQHLLNGPLLIPIDSILQFREKARVDEDLTVLGISPNLHRFCTNLQVFAVLPGLDTVGLLLIEKWDPVWSEGTYYFKKPQHLPEGTFIHAIAEFNNTRSASHDPNDTLKVVKVGPGEDEEEMIFNFTCLPYQSADENMVLDSLAHYEHYQDCKPMHIAAVQNQEKVMAFDFMIYPNPSSESLHFIFANDKAFRAYQLQFINMFGELLFIGEVNTADYRLNVSGFSSGLYFAKITFEDNIIIRKIIRE